MDQSLGGELDEPAEEAEVLDGDDHGVERLADMAGEVGQELDLDQLALGGLGPAFGPGAMFRQRGEFVEVRLSAVFRAAGS